MATFSFVNRKQYNAEEDLQCTICLKTFRNPKDLDCLHTFCLDCLEDLVKKEGKLTCPTCSRECLIPEGGLEKLPSNTYLKNILETIDKINKRKCFCGKDQPKYYCQNCNLYLCLTCTDHHKRLPITEDHWLLDEPMTIQEKDLLTPPLCSNHTKHYNSYCIICKIPICPTCIIMDHREEEGKHIIISISTAFQHLKETATEVKEQANALSVKSQRCIKEIHQNDKKLEKNRTICLTDIDYHVKELIKKIEANGNKRKNMVKTMYEEKKEISKTQVNELKTIIDVVNAQLGILNEVLECDSLSILQNSDAIFTVLKNELEVQPLTTVPKDDGNIFFCKSISSMQAFDIGNVTQAMADCLTLGKRKDVIEGQTTVVEIKTGNSEIDASQLKATWTQSTGDIIDTPVIKDKGNYYVKVLCTSAGICTLDVSVDGKPIIHSPMIIGVQKKGLVNTITTRIKNIKDVKYNNHCLLVSCLTNEIHWYLQSGEYIGKVELPESVKVNRMYIMKNGDIAFSDVGNNCIKICRINGQVIRSIGQEAQFDSPEGIHIDEPSNVLYVADMGIHSNMTMFNIHNGQMIRQIRSRHKNTDVTFMNEGKLILLNNITNTAEIHKPTINIFNKEGHFLEVLGNISSRNSMRLMNSHGVAVNLDGTMIITSEHKLQLFNRYGNFIKRIDKEEDEINDPWGLSIISYHLRKVAVANKGNGKIKVFNY